MATNEPMSDERLKAIRQRHSQGISLSAPDEHLYAYDDRAVLLAEVERLRAALEQKRQQRQAGYYLAELHIAELIADKDRLWGEVEAMRPIVEAVAEAGISYSEDGVGQCVFCLDYGDDDISLSHTPDCPIQQARAFVASAGQAVKSDE